jgi:hypothetical protein
MSRIDTVHARSRLAVRKRPYCHKPPSGGHLGYRKSKCGGSWIARWRDAHGKQHYSSMGPLTQWDPTGQLKEAAHLADDWFRSCSLANPISWAPDRRSRRKGARTKDRRPQIAGVPQYYKSR